MAVSRKYPLLGLTPATSLLFSGCPMNTASQHSAASAGRETPLVDKSIVLEDAAGAFLGYVTQTRADSVTVFTSRNYFVSLGWNGFLTDGTCWFTGTDGTGTLFFIAPNARRLFGLATSINGHVYVAATVDAFGFAVPDDSISGFRSYYSGGAAVTDAAGSVPAGCAAYVLRTGSLAEIGIPSSIATPWHLVFQ